MWQKLADLARVVWDNGAQTRRNTEAIAEMRAQLAEVTETLRLVISELRLLRAEIEHLKDNERHEREKMELRLRLEVSEKLRQLPTGNQN